MKKLLAVLMTAAMVVSLAACGGKKQETPAANETQAQQQAQAPAQAPAASNEAVTANVPEAEEGKTLIIATNQDMLSTDPQMLNSGSTTAILYNVYSNLVKHNDNAEVELDLAESYELSEDQLTWTFKIRQDAKFHNGDPVTAHDVAFSLTRVMTDETGSDYTNFSPLEKAEAIDDYTVAVTSKAPYPIMLNLLAKGGAAVLPEKYFNEKGLDGFLAAPIGSGPYILKEYVKDDHVTVVPFPDYYGEKNDDWDEVIFRVVPESSTRVGELLAGNVAIVNQVIPAEWDRVRNNAGTDIITGPTTRIYQLALKCDKEPTSDLRVRQAIDYAIDDQLLVDTILQGAGRPMLTRIPGGVNACNEDLVGKYNYDLEKAKALMAEAGYADGFTMKMTCPTGRYTMDTEINQAIAAMLSQINIKVELEMLEGSAYSNVFSAHSAEEGFMTCFGLGFFDASYGMIGYIGGNTEGESNWYDQAYVDLYEKAEFNMNLEERTAQMCELQQMIADQEPYVIIAQVDACYGIADGITMKTRLDDVWNITGIHKN